ALSLAASTAREILPESPARPVVHAVRACLSHTGRAGVGGDGGGKGGAALVGWDSRGCRRQRRRCGILPGVSRSDVAAKLRVLGASRFRSQYPGLAMVLLACLAPVAPGSRRRALHLLWLRADGCRASIGWPGRHR